VIEVDKSTIGPKALVNLSTRDHEPGLLEQHDQDVERLALQGHTTTLLAEFSGLLISLEYSEAEDLSWWSIRHVGCPVYILSLRHYAGGGALSITFSGSYQMMCN